MPPGQETDRMHGALIVAGPVLLLTLTAVLAVGSAGGAESLRSMALDGAAGPAALGVPCGLGLLLLVARRELAPPWLPLALALVPWLAGSVHSASHLRALDLTRGDPTSLRDHGLHVYVFARLLGAIASAGLCAALLAALMARRATRSGAVAPTRPAVFLAAIATVSCWLPIYVSDPMIGGPHPPHDRHEHALRVLRGVATAIDRLELSALAVILLVGIHLTWIVRERAKRAAWDPSALGVIPLAVAWLLYVCSWLVAREVPGLPDILDELPLRAALAP